MSTAASHVLRGVPQQVTVAEQVKHTCIAVYSALLVEPTYLDPTSGSTTTSSTSTRYCDDINMLTVPKQQHKRKAPSIFEGNKQDHSSGPTTTFKDWATK
eukprot:4281782-Amphidinium_carterae.1